MPVIPKGSKVLVSGANGYIAMWVVRHLLEQGYFVRGTVRSDEKGRFLQQYFSKLGFADKFEYVIVKDISKEGAFDDVVKDVDAIEHTASPFVLDIKESNDLLGPAIQGTTGILQSALKAGTKVQRIVTTSSVAAIMSPPEKPTVYSEEDWNTISPQEVERLGEKAPPMTIYRASKVLAEQAAWKFYETHKSKVSWDLVVINPPFVFGPPIHDVKSPSSLNTSLSFWWDAVVQGGENYKSKKALAASNSYVDVRDTAMGHVLALQKEEAAGQRFVTSAGGYIWQDWRAYISKIWKS